ncbi:MAG: 50S ribosomal protein L18e [Candidatus Woesearchaeota archaeon]
MTKRTGTTNPQMRGLIDFLKRQSIEQKVAFWKRIAEDLEKPSRKRRIINLHRINNHTKEDENIIVPGKVLGTGSLNHKVNVAAWSFSDSAVEKIRKANGNCISIVELMKKNPKGQNIRIIG